MRKEVLIRLDVDANTEDDYIRRYLEQMPFIYRAELLIYNAWGNIITAPRIDSSGIQPSTAQTPSEFKWEGLRDEGR